MNNIDSIDVEYFDKLKETNLGKLYLYINSNNIIYKRYFKYKNDKKDYIEETILDVNVLEDLYLEMVSLLWMFQYLKNEQFNNREEFNQAIQKIKQDLSVFECVLSNYLDEVNLLRFKKVMKNSVIIV